MLAASVVVLGVHLFSRGRDARDQQSDREQQPLLGMTELPASSRALPISTKDGKQKPAKSGQYMAVAGAP